MSELHRLLTEPDTTHLSDEMIALLAQLEATDQAIDVLFPVETTHLEQCEQCAEAHATLVELLLAVETDMVAAASAAQLGRSQSPWGKVLQWWTTIRDDVLSIQFESKPPRKLATLGNPAQTGAWHLAETTVEHTLPLSLRITAQRISTDLCQVKVSIDSVGLRKRAGCVVRLIANNTFVATTNAKGVARFEGIPIVALPSMRIEVQQAD